jgi:hypothetical protein
MSLASMELLEIVVVVIVSWPEVWKAPQHQGKVKRTQLLLWASLTTMMRVVVMPMVCSVPGSTPVLTFQEAMTKNVEAEIEVTLRGGCGLLAVTRVEAKTKATGTSSVDPRAFSQKVAETEASGWYCGWKVSEVAGMLWPAEALASAAVAMVSVVEDTLVKPSVEITLTASVVVPPPGLGPNAWLIPFRHVTSRDAQM